MRAHNHFIIKSLALLKPGAILVNTARGALLDEAAPSGAPDGAVERLIWIRNWRPEWQRTYDFLQPVRLPKGTRIVAYSGQPAEAAMVSASRR